MMRFLTLFLAFVLPASAVDVWFSFEDPAGVLQTNRPVYIYPTPEQVTNGTRLVTRDRISTNSAGGNVVVSNLLAGGFRSELSGKWGTTTNWYNFPNTNGLVYASSYVTVSTNLAGGLRAYSQQSVDGKLTTLSNALIAEMSNISGPTNGVTATTATNIANVAATNVTKALALTNPAAYFGATGKETNRVPYWTENTSDVNFRQKLVDGTGTNVLFTLRTHDHPNYALYLGGNAGGWDAVATTVKSSSLGGNTDPRITFLFDSLYQETWRFRETNFSLVLRDVDGGTFDPTEYDLFRHDYGTNLFIGNYSWGTTIRGTNLTLAVPSAVFTNTIAAKSFTGSGAGITNLPVAGISATGTPGATTYLRGDGSWQTPAGGGITALDATNAAMGVVAWTNPVTQTQFAAALTNNDTRNLIFKATVSHSNDVAIYSDGGAKTINFDHTDGVISAGSFTGTSPGAFNGDGSALTGIETNCIDSTFFAWINSKGTGTGSGLTNGSDASFSSVTVTNTGTNWFGASYFTNGIYGNGTGVTNLNLSSMATNSASSNKFLRATSASTAEWGDAPAGSSGGGSTNILDSGTSARTRADLIVTNGLIVMNAEGYASRTSFDVGSLHGITWYGGNAVWFQNGILYHFVGGDVSLDDGSGNLANALLSKSITTTNVMFKGPLGPVTTTAQGCSLSTDGTNLLVVFQNGAGTKTTNKCSLSSYP